MRILEGENLAVKNTYFNNYLKCRCNDYSKIMILNNSSNNSQFHNDHNFLENYIICHITSHIHLYNITLKNVFHTSL